MTVLVYHFGQSADLVIIIGNFGGIGIFFFDNATERITVAGGYAPILIFYGYGAAVQIIYNLYRRENICPVLPFYFYNPAVVGISADGFNSIRINRRCESVVAIVFQLNFSKAVTDRLRKTAFGVTDLDCTPPVRQLHHPPALIVLQRRRADRISFGIQFRNRCHQT